jgi:hypothetical protein
MNKSDIEIETIRHARIDKVWRDWTDARLRGSFEISFENSDKTEHTCFGVYETPLHTITRKGGGARFVNSIAA